MRDFWTLLAVLFGWGSVSILLLGGRVYHGPATSSGFRPEYTHSGFRYYVLSMMLAVPYIHYHSMLTYYDNFVTLIAYLIVVSFAIGWLLYIKGESITR